MAPSFVLHDAIAHQVRDGSYPLHMAMQNGTTASTVERMIAVDVGVLELINKRGETLLHIAVANNESDEIVKLLLKTPNGISLVRSKESSHGNLPIHTAVIHGCSVEVAKELLRLYPRRFTRRTMISKSLVSWQNIMVVALVMCFNFLTP